RPKAQKLKRKKERKRRQSAALQSTARNREVFFEGPLARSKNRRDFPPITNAHRSPLSIMNFAVGGNSQRVIHRRQHILWADRVLRRIRGDAVALSIRLPAAHAGAGERHGVARAPVPA